MMLRVTELMPSRTLEYASPEMWKSNPGPLLPGQAFIDRFKPRLPYRVSVNQLGFRGADVPLRKGSGTSRVLCLGDSYTFGAYVDDEATWPAALETILREKEPDRSIEVINAEISGFTIVDELAFLKEHGLDLEPDIVVLGFVLNDLADLTRRVSSREMLRRASEESAASALGPLKARLRQTATYNMLFIIKAYLLKAVGADPTVQEVDIRHLLKTQYDTGTLELFDQYRSHLVEMKHLLDESEIPLVLLIFPYWEQIAQGATDQAQRRMAAMAQELEIATVDLLPAFRHSDPRGRKFFNMPRDHHPSARGYRKAALDLAKALEPLLAAHESPRQPGPAAPPASSGGEP